MVEEYKELDSLMKGVRKLMSISLHVWVITLDFIILAKMKKLLEYMGITKVKHTSTALVLSLRSKTLLCEANYSYKSTII